MKRGETDPEGTVSCYAGCDASRRERGLPILSVSGHASWSGCGGGINTLMLTPLAALERLLVAALIGALIGLDRERAEVRKTAQVFAGVRTFPLIALAGAVPMLVFDVIGPSLLIASFLTLIGGLPVGVTAYCGLGQ